MNLKVFEIKDENKGTCLLTKEAETERKKIQASTKVQLFFIYLHSVKNPFTSFNRLTGYCKLVAMGTQRKNECACVQCSVQCAVIAVVLCQFVLAGARACTCVRVSHSPAAIQLLYE